MISETDPLGYSIAFTYNQFAEPLTFVNQEGYTTTYQYDASGDLLQTTNPDGTTQQYVYNNFGEVTSSTDEDGATITYAYNPNAQLTVENLPGSTSNSYTYDAHGNMLTADGPGGDWSFTYNSQNLPTTIAEPYGTLTISYGVDGNVTKLVDQTGFTTNYVYDAVGRVSELTGGSGDLIESYSYNPAGNVISETKGNGTSTTYQYNADGDITEITNLAPGGSVNSQMTYAYNSVGEVTSQTTGGVTTNYTYDADGELISAVAAGDSIEYAYDPDGNRTSVTENGVVTNYASNDVNEYTSTATNGVTTSYQYDPNGNLIAATTSGQTTSYTFNALNQLTGVSGGLNGTFSYVYDPLGYQISATVNGQTTNNLLDPFGLGNVAAQFNSSATLVAHYTYGLGLVSQVTASGNSYYYDYNLQGSTVGITNSAGVYVNQYSYDPFGQVTTISAGIPNPFTFVGQYGVSSDRNGLTYMRARYYEPSIGQFVSNDPLGLGGGDPDVRRYAFNSPLSLIDPTGLDCPSKDGKQQGKKPGPMDKGEQEKNPKDPQTSDPQPTPWQDELNDILKKLYGGSPPSNPDNTNNYVPYIIILGGVLLRLAPLLVAADDPDNNCNCDQNPHPDPPPPPAPPCIGCGSGGGGNSNNQVSHDPNDLIGPSGYGPAGFLTTAGALPYTIEFSNEKTAAVPADNVTVTEQLSPNLDWRTFQLGTIGFGNYVVNVPPGVTSFSTRVDATAALGVYVEIDASLNLTTGLLTVTFTSLDPNTLDTPSNPLLGFLPPDTNPPDGEGYINYTIQPKPGLATGAALNAQASIVFDTNAPIATPQITNTIDATPPTSTVTILPATTTSPSFPVSWSGSDPAGPGIATFNVYVSDNGAPFTLWQSATTTTSATYTGQLDHTYAFYSVATDNVGLIQPTPTSAEATTEVIPSAPPPPPLVTVQSVQLQKIKLGKGKKAKNETVVLVQFSGALNAATADNASAYAFAPIVTEKAKGKGKHKKPPTTKLGTPVPPATAVYTSSNNQVTLTPRGTLNLTKPEELIIDAALLTDTLGREVEGTDDGETGGDYIATLSGTRVIPGGPSVVRTTPFTARTPRTALLSRFSVRFPTS